MESTSMLQLSRASEKNSPGRKEDQRTNLLFDVWFPFSNSCFTIFSRHFPFVFLKFLVIF